MDWLELTVLTTTEGSELVSQILIDAGASGTVIAVSYTHLDRAYARGRSIAEKLKEVIPRQLFEIPIQAAVGGRVIARETVKALRKDCLLYTSRCV